MERESTMTQANFKFISDDLVNDLDENPFTVVSFTGNEAISTLYEYQIELKAPLSYDINLDDVLDSPASFVIDLDGIEYPVHGILSNFQELQTTPEYIYYKAVLVPRLWALSNYKTNEIYTDEKTVDEIIKTVFTEANNEGLGIDFDLTSLVKTDLLVRDYVCQFGESDFDFLSRLLENEGIYFYFDQSSGVTEKIIFINDMNYEYISHPGLIFDVTPSTSKLHDSIDAWSCRKQRLAAGVSVRDYNSEHPSVDISRTFPIDNALADTHTQGIDYIYGGNIQKPEEASYLSEIRAQQALCNKTRYYGEGSVTRLQAGYLFEMEMHPNGKYNGIEYLAVEVNHEGQHLDMALSSNTTKKNPSKPQYRNSFVAIEASEQFRPALVTPKPRFFGTMTAFIYGEGEVDNIAQVDDFGRYRVHLPFDRADGANNDIDPPDPHRKASAWIRMAHPFVGQNSGIYFPLTDGTEVLLTFINGDPDQPVISGAVPNASRPSRLNSGDTYNQIVSSNLQENISGNTISIGGVINDALETFSDNDLTVGLHSLNSDLDEDSVNQGKTISGTDMELSDSMLPPWSKSPPDNYEPSLIKFKNYPNPLVTTLAPSMADGDWKSGDINIDRGAGDNYVYANARTFAYPQHERVYFIGTFHEDFHVKDDFLNAANSWTGVSEQFSFPAPGKDFPEGLTGVDNSDLDVNPKGVRGVAEAKIWGDQMNYAWGRSFNWAGGPALGGGDNGSFAEYNYGNGHTENLQNSTGGTSADLLDAEKEHMDDYTTYGEFMGANLANVSVEKTFGTTYSYQNGFSLDIKVGNAYERVYGDVNEEVHGHVVSHVRGSSHGTHHGAVSEMFLGAKNEFAWSFENAIHGGLATDFYGGLKVDFFLGGTLNINLAADFFVGFGANIGYQGGIVFTYTGGAGVEKKSTRIKDVPVEVKNNLVNFKKAITDFTDGTSVLNKAGLKLELASMFIFA